MSKRENKIDDLARDAVEIGVTDESDPAAREVLARLDRAGRRYRRLRDDSAPPAGVVVVGIGWEPHLRPLADPTASVMWAELRGADERRDADGSGPHPVPEAFATAHAIAARFGAEVAVSIGQSSHWREEWGTLVEDDDV